MNIYSNAEVLFGFHTIFTWDWSAFIRTFIEGLFGMIPGASTLQTGVQMYQSAFHAGGIFGFCSSQASSYVDEYVQKSINASIIQLLGEKAKRPTAWASNLISVLAASALSAFNIPNPLDITIYNRIRDIPDYSTIVDKYDGNMSIEELIQISTEN